ncbi:VirB4-like protein [Vibrio ordalii]|uniref:VirB4 family type IV secretion/conjugal transfer ATPase n=1 Tax=Vibrio ordalii TaxID=28174 RepID=UPI00024835C5|nr:VirB4-like protein [Vibrio ordalii]
MSNAKELYQRLSKVPKLTEMFPLLYVKGDHTVVAKDGSYIAILELEGLDYTGMNSNQYDLLYNVRKRLFEKDSPFYLLDIVSKKNRISAKDKIETNVKNQLLSMITKAWQNNFDVAYRTKHYIVISVKKSGFMSKVGALVSDDWNIDKDEELARLISEISVELEEYHPKLLVNEALSSYFATQLNGRETHLNSRHWDQPLSNQPITFDSKQNFCTYGRHGDTIYSGWLSISRYSETIKKDTLERIFKLPYRFNIYQSFKTYPKAIALGMMEEEYKRIVNWGGRQ